MNEKVFCIGLPKTGTTSLSLALTILGYNVCRRLLTLQHKLPNIDLIDRLKKKDYNEIIKETVHFDAFVDNPWLLLYKELDHKYPDAKFILTIRNENDWLKSILNYFRNSTSEMRLLIFGESSPLNNEDEYLKKYRKHNQDVIEYFQKREQKLLILELEKNDKWEVLCKFLEEEIPEASYPKENVTPKSIVAKKKKLNKNHLSNFLKIPFKKKLLFLEVFFYLALMRFLILIIPFKQLAKKMGALSTESEYVIPTNQQLESILIGKAIRKFSRLTPFRSLCFEQALTCKMMLNRRRISSTIYFGLSKEKFKGNELQAHAWLRSGDIYLTGRKGMKNFKIVAFFGSKKN